MTDLPPADLEDEDEAPEIAAAPEDEGADALTRVRDDLEVEKGTRGLKSLRRDRRISAAKQARIARLQEAVAAGRMRVHQLENLSPEERRRLGLGRGRGH